MEKSKTKSFTPSSLINFLGPHTRLCLYSGRMKAISAKFLLLFLVSFPLSLWAKDLDPQKVSSTGPPTSIEALEAYPSDIRQAALEVSLHHNLLIEVKGIQSQAATQLRKMIGTQPREFQNQVYQLIRFPKLILELTAGGPKTPKQIRGILQTYPKEIHKIAQNLTRNHFSLLKKIDEINQASNKKFEALIANYPPQTRKAYLKILQHPVILDILSKNLKYSYLLGQAYEQGKEAGKQSRAAVTASARKKDDIASAARKRELALDPQSEELTKAANEFVAKADTQLDTVLDPKKAVQVNVTYDPYFNSYWNAYPGFYNDPYWYGFPDWGYWGW